jgi:hypothetical protein
MNRKELSIALLRELCSKIVDLESCGLTMLIDVKHYDMQTVFDRAFEIRDIIYTQTLLEKNDFKTTQEVQKWVVGKIEEYRVKMLAWCAAISTEVDQRDTISYATVTRCHHCWQRAIKLENYCLTCHKALHPLDDSSQRALHPTDDSTP